MKKLMSIILALVMVMSLSVAAFAEETKNTTVRASVSEHFEWDVPAEILLEQNSYNCYIGSGSVTFSNVLLKEDNAIQLTAASANGWTIDGNGYYLTINGQSSEDGDYVSDNDDVCIQAEMTATHAADNATDTVTFKAEIVNVA